MTKRTALTAVGFLAAAFVAFAADPSVWYEGNGVTVSGTLGGPGTAWSIDAHRSSRWAVEPATGAISIRYTIPGTKLTVR